MDKLLDFVCIKNYRRIRGVNSKKLYKNSNYLNEFDQAKNIKLDLESHKKIFFKEDDLHRTGNWLSFLFLFKDLASLSSSQPFLILEDDIDLKIDFVPLFLKSLQVAPMDWELLLCGYEHHRSNKNKHIQQASKKIWIPTEFFVCTHCMIVRNSSIANRIASQLDVPVFNSATDLVINSLIFSKNLIVYASKEPMSSQRRDIFFSNSKNPGNIPKYKLQNSAVELMNK